MSFNKSLWHLETPLFSLDLITTVETRQKCCQRCRVQVQFVAMEIETDLIKMEKKQFEFILRNSFMAYTM